MKVCLVASRGGHLEELQFIKYIDLNCEYFMITETMPTNIKVELSKVYYVDQINRKEPNIILKIIKLFLKGRRILKKEEPDCFISTGALIAVPILFLGKLYHKKVVFIETFARVESGSLSGKITYKFADVFIVYWKNLLKIYPKAIYINPFEERTNDTSYGRDTEIFI